MLKFNILPRKILISVITLVIFISCICLSSVLQIKSYAVQTTETYSSKVANYPGYQSLINELQSKHPNWKFKILYTGLDWNQVIKNETTASHGRNLVSNTKTGAWVCGVCGDQSYDTGKWKCASEIAVSYYMDPRNWLNDDYIFQFEVLSYDETTQNVEGINKILNKAEWAKGNTITYTKTDGTTGTINKSYAQVILEAAQEANISPYHLASRIVQEQGTNSGLSSTAKGTYTDYVGYYNFCNIGATGNSSSTVIANALTYAKNKGWTDPEISIKQSAIYIANSYIKVGQNTLYLQKFDVDNSDGKLYYHQYMQNVSAVVAESSSVKKSYSDMGMINNSFTFLIPVYENMPNEKCASPDSFSVVTQNVEIKGTNIQVRNSPSLLGTVITKVNEGDKLLRIECAESMVSGHYWDKIVLPTGVKGYISRNYISQIGDITNCNISAVANTSVNLRNGPGTSGTTVVTTLISGQALTIIEKGAYNNLNEFDWVRVRLASGVQGYIASKYLTEVNGNETNGGNATYMVATINCNDGSKVRIRSSATTSAAIVTSIDKGITVTVVQENVATANGYVWDKIVTSDGLEGFIANQYLKKPNTTININPIDSNYKISGNNLCVLPNATAEGVKNAFQSNSISIKNSAGVELSNNAKIGTGCVVSINGNTYTIAKKGDLDGDGEVDTLDSVITLRHYVGSSNLTGAFLEAGDANSDGEIDTLDSLLILKQYLNTGEIKIN